jgi:transcriptional regulator with XRE-family HTH domain
MLVHKLRLQRGWSQEQLADLSGLSVRTIQRIERGGSASIESLKALAAVFEVDFHQLRQEVDMSDAPHPAPAHDPSSAPPPVAIDARGASLPSDETLVLAQVRRIRGFYGHLAQYLLVMTGLVVINAIWSPRFWWAPIVAVSWGAGLLGHALRAFDWWPFLGADWERRQVEKRLKRSL